MFDRLTVAGGTSAARCGTAVAVLDDAVIVGAPKYTPPAGGTVRVFETPVQPLAWATVLEPIPDPNVVTDAMLRAGIVATRLPWRVRDDASGIEMLLVPPGTFEMGCSASNQYGCASNEFPIRETTISLPFYLGRYEVTQLQWTSRMGSNPSGHQGANYPNASSRPVENVSWNMIQGFLAGSGLRLPTEAEWEHACRGGTDAAFHNGTSDDQLASQIAWFNASQTSVVGLRSTNALGLHDMSGNVWEYVNDWYSPTFDESTVHDPTGPETGTHRTRRGGCWADSSSAAVRSSSRGPEPPAWRDVYFGFRVARTP
jgi:formylglycine-generating enzyme required for sulfatase activity